MPTPRERAAAVLRDHGTTFGTELGFEVRRNTPSPLFRMACFALVASTRISHHIAMDAARELAKAGWTTARKLASSTWQQRVDALGRAHYVRYDESTARMLGETAELLLDEYSGDLRRLRAASREDPAEERRRLMACKGIGEVGADIFFREVQAAWTEHYPLLDPLAARAAQRWGLPTDAQDLAELVNRSDFERLVCGLVRLELEHREPDQE